MTFTYTYGSRWGRLSKAFGIDWPESKARKAHEQGKLYAVLVHKDGKPYCFVQVVGFNNGVEVGFFNEHMQPYLEYGFSRRDMAFNKITTGDLFLNQVSDRKRLPPPSDEVIYANILYIKPDGHYRAIRHDLVTDLAQEAEFQDDVSGLWEPWPQFGKYESIIRKERPYTPWPRS